MHRKEQERCHGKNQKIGRYLERDIGWQRFEGIY